MTSQAVQTLEKPKLKAPPIIDALPLQEGSIWKLQNNFKAYYKWPALFYKKTDPYDDWIFIIDGPRGGGKTTAAVALSILDGQMRGIPVISNVPIEWTAWDSTGRPFIVQSIPFDVTNFVEGDDSLYCKRVFIDEANYNIDRLRGNSTKNLQIADILQQARKFKMTVVLATINANWIDGRATYMGDVSISVKDIYNTGYGRKHGILKGSRSQWDMYDLSGKKTGKANSMYKSIVFNNQTFWNTFNTYNFIKSIDIRRRKIDMRSQKMITDTEGNEIPANEFYDMIEKKYNEIPDGQYNNRRWWDMIGIVDDKLKLLAGKHLSKLGAQRAGHGLGDYYKKANPV